MQTSATDQQKILNLLQKDVVGCNLLSFGAPEKRLNQNRMYDEGDICLYIISGLNDLGIFEGLTAKYENENWIVQSSKLPERTSENFAKEFIRLTNNILTHAWIEPGTVDEEVFDKFMDNINNLDVQFNIQKKKKATDGKILCEYKMSDKVPI